MYDGEGKEHESHARYGRVMRNTRACGLGREGSAESEKTGNVAASRPHIKPRWRGQCRAVLEDSGLAVARRRGAPAGQPSAHLCRCVHTHTRAAVRASASPGAGRSTGRRVPPRGSHAGRRGGAESPHPSPLPKGVVLLQGLAVPAVGRRAPHAEPEPWFSYSLAARS